MQDYLHVYGGGLICLFYDIEFFVIRGVFQKSSLLCRLHDIYLKHEISQCIPVYM